MQLFSTTNPDLETFYCPLHGQGVMLVMEGTNEADARQKIAVEHNAGLGLVIKEDWEKGGAELRSVTLDEIEAAKKELAGLDARKAELENELRRLRDRCDKFGLVEKEG